MRRLGFVLAALAFLACGGTRAPLAGVPSSSSTSTVVPSPAPAVSRCGDADPLARVFHPDRLQVLVRCQEARGQVLAVEREADGDWHIWLILDGAYENLLAPSNIYRGRRALLLEITPDCVHRPANARAAARCPSSRLSIPNAGERIDVWGPYVADLDHGGWHEIHSVTSWERLG